MSAEIEKVTAAAIASRMHLTRLIAGKLDKTPAKDGKVIINLQNGQRFLLAITEITDAEG